jgi:HPt (histidine-containing phosphotransfer) domain-containing protein
VEGASLLKSAADLLVQPLTDSSVSANPGILYGAFSGDDAIGQSPAEGTQDDFVCPRLEDLPIVDRDAVRDNLPDDALSLRSALEAFLELQECSLLAMENALTDLPSDPSECCSLILSEARRLSEAAGEIGARRLTARAEKTAGLARRGDSDALLTEIKALKHDVFAFFEEIQSQAPHLQPETSPIV